jgi:hypothetical protein
VIEAGVKVEQQIVRSEDNSLARIGVYRELSY